MSRRVEVADAEAGAVEHRWPGLAWAKSFEWFCAGSPTVTVRLLETTAA
jgi:hypothetical protein